MSRQPQRTRGDLEPKRRPKTWIVVVDGRRARVYRVVKAGSAIEPVSEEMVAPEAQLETRELGTDKPGVVFSSTGGMASAVEQTDWQRQAMERFAHEVAAFLNAAAQSKSFDRLVVAAPPKTLGELRAGLNGAATERIQAEVAKDLTAVAPDKLLDHISDLVNLGPARLAQAVP